LTKIYHPDTPTGDNEKFITIKSAFEEIEMYYENRDERVQRLRKEEEERRKAEEEALKAKNMQKYWEAHPEEYTEHLEKLAEEKRKLEALERLKQEAERQRAARTRELEQQERERKAAYERFVKEQKERQEKFKIKSDLSINEMKELHEQKVRQE